MKDNTKQLMVTIQCITYNHEPFIRQCLEGIVMQRTNFRFEAIVHDDASTDGTVAIIKEYAERFPDIIKPFYEDKNLYSKQDGSLVRTVHQLSCKSSAKYVALCEGDDYWIDPLKLQKQVDFLENNLDYSICGTNGLILYEDYFESAEYFLDLKKSRRITNSELIQKWCFPTASIVCRINVIEHYPEWAYKLRNGDLTLIFMSMMYGQAYCLSDLTCVYRKIVGDSLQWQYWKKHIHESQSQLILLYDQFEILFNGTDISDLLNKEKNVRIKRFKRGNNCISLFNPKSWKRYIVSIITKKLKHSDYKKFHTTLDR